MSRKWNIVLIVAFLAVMMAFTEISRIREEERTPKVRVTTAQVKEIDTVEGKMPYFGCVPVSALYRDETGGYYVYVAEPQETILGERMEARSVGVRIDVQDEEWAALSQGSLGNQQRIIYEADREVRDGYPVIVLDNEELEFMNE